MALIAAMSAFMAALSDCNVSIVVLISPRVDSVARFTGYNMILV
jgi:hypothetical protein